MKRAFAAAVFGGLVMFFVPQAASGGAAQPVAPSDHSADHKADCPGQTQGSPDSPEQAPPQRQPEGDREQKDSDDSEILF
jgi:hypothetical protein